MPTQHNSPIYINHHPHVDAGPVAVCRAAGALIYGKTVIAYFLSPLHSANILPVMLPPKPSRKLSPEATPLI
jgi:Asp-tRNA(Asn)/Glu-tRNA(Gln) amidotransferase A subunit family amidase